ncbi:Ent-kaurene oxidase [Penicillium subrubescens]|uniref:Ent-kaurene oxidase n=1 Tax=Penicillium subrubescens TaxID=1316194 RepID=A0A1Q5UEF5_9EURO|nr:Ent-kaurene oxidase [Penicillium subrubescens]
MALLEQVLDYRNPQGALLLGAVIFGVLLYKFALSRRRANLPVYGTHTGWQGSWKDSMDYVRDSPGVLKAGYEKFSKHGLFYQLRTPVRWVIVVPPKFVDEIRTAPPTHLSAREAANDVQQARNTVSPIVEENKFHFHIIKTHLTPSLELKISDLLDEISLVFAEEIGRPAGKSFLVQLAFHLADWLILYLTDWKQIVMAPAAHRIATRVANRLLVGAPLCRNEEYLQTSIKYTVDVFGGADRLRAWPDFLKPMVTYFITNVKERQRVARKHLLPYIKNRLTQLEYPKSQGSDQKPIDSLQWVIDAAPSAEERDPERLMYRLLHLNVAAVHTTSVTFLNCIFDLALHVDVHSELRTEIGGAIDNDGWTARGLSHMRKLDSFMLESQRLAPIASCE